MTNQDVKAQLLHAALPLVPFDGWSAATFEAAIAETGLDKGVAYAACPRGAVDLALAFHAAGDRKMLERLGETDLCALRFRDRIAAAIRIRLDVVDDKELVRRSMALFSLPHLAPDGAKAVWTTCDSIWTALGDTSDDVNWYTKRATLSGVYGATVLYWLGDDSPEHVRTGAFLDRRIGDVMQIEKFKAQARDNKVLGRLMAGPNALLGRIKPPSGAQQTGMPGRWSGPQSGDPR